MKILVTGFDPFGGASENASWSAVSRQPSSVRGVDITFALLPTKYDACVSQLTSAIKARGVTHVLSFGLAGDRSGMTPETWGFNYANASIADNAGVLKKGTLIAPNRPLALAPNLLTPAALAQAMKDYGVDAFPSFDAGSFVCNNLIYGAMNAIATDPQLAGVKFAFCHTPDMTGGVGYQMPLDTIRRAVFAAIVKVIESELGPAPESIAQVTLGQQPGKTAWFAVSPQQVTYIVGVKNVLGLAQDQATATGYVTLDTQTALYAEAPTLEAGLVQPRWQYAYDTSYYKSWFLFLSASGKDTDKLIGTHKVTVTGLDSNGVPFRKSANYQLVQG